METKLVGELDYFDGMPSKATVEKANDFLDSAHGVEAFLNGIPAASVYSFLEGLKRAGLRPGDLGIAEDLLDARNLWLTANASTVYCVTELNLKDGPVVAEVPLGMLGTVDDAFFRFVVDIGPTGPDKGKGGKFLFVPSSYKGPIAKGRDFVLLFRLYGPQVSIGGQIVEVQRVGTGGQLLNSVVKCEWTTTRLQNRERHSKKRPHYTKRLSSV